MGKQRRRPAVRQMPRLVAPLSLLLATRLAHGAAFAPGAEADPPTGEVRTAVAASAAEPLAGNGIQWRLAPWRVGGTVTLDWRSLRLEEGRRERSTLLLGDIDFASYLWQPWFVQVRFGLGWVASQSSGDEGASSRSFGLTGRAGVSVFPASRFPFELRADVSDSRSGGLTLGGDYRSRRIAATQSWRPERSNASLQASLEHSVLEADGAQDRLTTFNASGLNQIGPHRFDLGTSFSEHRSTDQDEKTRIGSLTARHGYAPSHSLQVDTLASWNEVRVDAPGFDSGTEVRQLSTFATWRLPDGTFAGLRGAPLVTGNARWTQARTLGSAGGSRADALNATVGLSTELGTDWRLGLSGSASQVRTPNTEGRTALGMNGSLAWAPRLDPIGGWRYAPSVTVNGGIAHEEQRDDRKVAGLQASHALSRDFALGERSRLALGLAQSAGVQRESGRPELARALAHAANLGLQTAGAGGSQSFLSVSASDSRSFGETRGGFQLVNLQLTQRTPITRYSNWSANFTAQATRNRTSDVDPFTGERRELTQDWRPFYSGGATYEHQRAFGVPRLRFSALFSANSQPLERRSLGDIDAPRERITESLEARLDYAVGRLDTRLSARAARVDGRSVVGLQARAQRRF